MFKISCEKGCQTPELLEKVEAYIQEEIEMMHKPTVLH